MNLLSRIAAAFHNVFCRFGVSCSFVPQLFDPRAFQFAQAVRACTAADLLGHRLIKESVYDTLRGFSKRNTEKPDRVNLIRKDAELCHLASRTLREESLRHGIRRGSCVRK